MVKSNLAITVTGIKGRKRSGSRLIIIWTSGNEVPTPMKP